MKKDKKALPYSLYSNMLYSLKKAWQLDKILFFATLIQIPILVLLPLLTTYMSKYIVQLVTQQVNIDILIKCILLLSTSILALHLVNNFVKAKIEWRSFGNRFLYIDILNQKNMEMDYEILESPEGQMKAQKAQNIILSNSGGTQQIFSQIVAIISNIVGVIAYSIILMTFNIWVVLLLFSMTVVSYLLSKYNNIWYHKNKDHIVSIDRKLGYIQNKSGDFEAAKDIRLYKMSVWFSKLFTFFLYERVFWWKKAEKRICIVDCITAVMNFVRDGIAYAVLIYQVVNENLFVADFVLYFALIAQYSSWLMGIIGAYSELQKTSLGFCDLREFLDLKDKFNHNKGTALPATAPEILLKDVSFQYPGSTTYTLKDITFTIKSGEKIAIVGLNGAGKTTLVKLLCGLYAPTSGQIYISGNNMLDYNVDEYYSLLSVVFQDILLLPASIAKNIALCAEEKIDYNKLNKVLKLAGLYDMVQLLPQKENTLLIKSVHDNAIDLSGGEKQKLILARALYKDGLIVILDEPTAALDPIAESEMYQEYDKMTQQTTSVFISHRLASTRFCDRIIFLEDGKIVEQGTHDQLIKLNGKYANLFQIQSQYYKDGVSK